eukprot:TRINITY_DN19158_c0_g2_i1.p1 TRINITY_DN19158_c0_g2~~TRINITY_DN19158_c0_g2_i1.p1  ORF type:complete len:275 (-),score=15.71 TRINITY_DN19158_c0_g2_i1:127-864(-)
MDLLPQDYKPTATLFQTLQAFASESWWKDAEHTAPAAQVIWESQRNAWWKVAQGVDLAPIHTFALFAYTHNDAPLHSQCRSAILSGSEETLNKWRPVIYALQQALEALPVCSESRLLRGISVSPTVWDQQFFSKDKGTLKPGNEIRWSTFVSTTTDVKLADVAHEVEKRGCILLIKGEHGGRNITPFSHSGIEDEVLLPPGLVLKVEAIHKSVERMVRNGEGAATVAFDKAKTMTRLIVVATVVP